MTDASGSPTRTDDADPAGAHPEESPVRLIATGFAFDVTLVVGIYLLYRAAPVAAVAVVAVYLAIFITGLSSFTADYLRDGHLRDGRQRRLPIAAARGVVRLTCYGLYPPIALVGG